MTLTARQIAALPKVVLHDHLDGGVRPTTVVERSAQVGHQLPVPDPDELGQWFHRQASAGSLDGYLETFTHTLAVMQDAEGLAQVAREAVGDLAADGVVYAEERFAPELHQRGGLSLHQVVDAVRAGVDEGIADAARAGHTIQVGLLLCAIRQKSDRSEEIAALALSHRDRGVVGFDIAGPELGFPARGMADAFAALRRAWFPVTVHAGEEAGAESIADALGVGALRIGHGVQLLDDIEHTEHGPQLGRLAQWVRDRRIALEVCPTSNVQTGAACSVAEHPVTTLHRLGFAVTVNTDNRLQSATSMSRELGQLVEQAGWTIADVEEVTVTAARSAFLPIDERRELIDRVIRPGFSSGK